MISCWYCGTVGVQKQWLVFYLCGRILNLINSKRLGVVVALLVIVQAFNWLGFPHRVWARTTTPEAKLHTHTHTWTRSGVLMLYGMWLHTIPSGLGITRLPAISLIPNGSLLCFLWLKVWLLCISLLSSN